MSTANHIRPIVTRSIIKLPTFNETVSRDVHNQLNWINSVYLYSVQIKLSHVISKISTFSHVIVTANQIVSRVINSPITLSHVWLNVIDRRLGRWDRRSILNFWNFLIDSISLDWRLLSDWLIVGVILFGTSLLYDRVWLNGLFVQFGAWCEYNRYRWSHVVC